MILFTNAKINLGLNVVSRRPDGYHDLLTVFYPVGRGSGCPGAPGCLSDIVEIVPAATGTDSFETAGNRVDCPPEKNLVWRALRIFRENYPSLPPVSITLEKHVPDGAGMGGGSADASFTLRGLNEMAGSPFDDDSLARMALRLGADCPFFIYNRPMAARGVGDILTPVDVDLSDYTLVILKPEQGISTAEAFSHVVPSEPALAPAALMSLRPEQWRGCLVNDFEESMFAIHPSLRRLNEYLYGCGAAYASMTGSGSAFFGLFADPIEAASCVEKADVPFATLASL